MRIECLVNDSDYIEVDSAIRAGVCQIDILDHLTSDKVAQVQLDMYKVELLINELELWVRNNQDVEY